MMALRFGNARTPTWLRAARQRAASSSPPAPEEKNYTNATSCFFFSPSSSSNTSASSAATRCAPANNRVRGDSPAGSPSPTPTPSLVSDASSTTSTATARGEALGRSHTDTPAPPRLRPAAQRAPGQPQAADPGPASFGSSTTTTKTTTCATRHAPTALDIDTGVRHLHRLPRHVIEFRLVQMRSGLAAMRRTRKARHRREQEGRAGWFRMVGVGERDEERPVYWDLLERLERVC